MRAQYRPIACFHGAQTPVYIMAYCCHIKHAWTKYSRAREIYNNNTPPASRLPSMPLWFRTSAESSHLQSVCNVVNTTKRQSTSCFTVQRSLLHSIHTIPLIYIAFITSHQMECESTCSRTRATSNCVFFVENLCTRYMPARTRSASKTIL